MGETVNIAFVFDGGFVDLFRVAACSIARNTEANLSFSIVDCGIGEDARGRIKELVAGLENVSSVEFGTPERLEVFEKYRIPACFSPAIFYRLVIPKVFPGLKRVIYLDCDIVATGNIAELWAEDIHGRALGMVEDFNDEKIRPHAKLIGLPAGKCYFNTGVMVIDCEKFVEAEIFERTIHWVGKKKNLAYPDQDALNLCLAEDECWPLASRYNFAPFTPASKAKYREDGNVVIVHYYAGLKPWLTSPSVVGFFHSIGIGRFAAKFLLEFWKYADAVGFKSRSEHGGATTCTFFYKCLFQPLERFLRRKRRECSNRLRHAFGEKPKGKK